MALSNNNKLKEIYNDGTLENNFVKVFNYFVNKTFTDAYKGFTMDAELSPAKIAVMIEAEPNNKVAIYKSKLYLYNIDNYIEFLFFK